MEDCITAILITQNAAPILPGTASRCWSNGAARNLFHPWPIGRIIGNRSASEKSSWASDCHCCVESDPTDLGTRGVVNLRRKTAGLRHSSIYSIPKHMRNFRGLGCRIPCHCADVRRLVWVDWQQETAPISFPSICSLMMEKFSEDVQLCSEPLQDSGYRNKMSGLALDDEERQDIVNIHTTEQNSGTLSTSLQTGNDPRGAACFLHAG
jgi:hypothetical protein